MFAANSPRPMSRSLRVLAALLPIPTRGCAPTSRRCATCSTPRPPSPPSRRAEIEALMDTLRRADPLETEAAYVEMFDRGRATSLHLFEHVHGDSRDRGPAMIDLGETYDKAGLILTSTRAAGLPAGRAGIRVHAAAARGARVPGRDRAHPERAVRRAVQARKRLRQRGRRADRAGRGEGAGGRGCPPKSRSTKAGPSRWCSTAVRPKARPSPARRSRSTSSARVSPTVPNRERPHEPRHVLPEQLPVRRLSVHLPGGVLHGQPGALRPRPVHVEERLVAAAARRDAALGQQPVPRRHPVPVLRAPVRAADAALDVRAVHHARRRSRCWRSSPAAWRARSASSA